MHSLKLSDFPDSVSAVLESLIGESETDSIWFIGSRANGTEREDSDWDFIAFVTDITAERSARSGEVDIVRVDREGNCLLEGKGLALKHPFKTWRWRRIGPNRASYTVRVTPEVDEQSAFDLSEVENRELRAIKVWSRDAL